MANITIITTPVEQKQVIEALKRIGEVVVPVSKIAKEAGLTESRARYALTDLVESGAVEKIPFKAFNKHYVRYSYRVVKEYAL